MRKTISLGCATVMSLVLGSCGTDPELRTGQGQFEITQSDPCAGKACGDPCPICAPDDPDCTGPAIRGYCNPAGECRLSRPVCEAYDPCVGKRCGASCTICPPYDKDCVEPAVMNYCTAKGDCRPDRPACHPPELCIQTGGTIGVASCCNSVGDFPNTCMLGACGCSPETSHKVQVCQCSADECFDPSVGCR